MMSIIDAAFHETMLNVKIMGPLISHFSPHVQLDMSFSHQRGKTPSKRKIGMKS